ncbi:5-formyltetrahydrofolate cyclo-ligase [Algoriphagus sp. D3-2-R+10]|uniref:5-formyltetrahydrofolate cyclo-ligase n=1 Tax=Algoriphagus aurantiacus TaxID=3103948 RepID=UPI002B3F9292|nr:5-formyltetrahydrofolate cyclo-ligase [Algoriphagus sp. D3-2-R+10]MEB2776679.1 5-formyltetrahydrofolate cyclo-ligase [Algoriphagus sp. D3-2-R+10]
MSLDKHELRTFYKELRAALSDKELEDLSVQITNNVIAFLDKREELKHFHLFFPIPELREINTYSIRDYLEERASHIYTSRVELGSLELQTLLLMPKTKFEFDKWGIPLPVDYKLATNQLIQVVFVPLLAFDQNGNRIGFGKGYYDVFLASLDPSVLKIGLSFFSAELIIPSELHDIALDYCITPKNIITF